LPLKDNVYLGGWQKYCDRRMSADHFSLFLLCKKLICFYSEKTVYARQIRDDINIIGENVGKR